MPSPLAPRFRGLRTYRRDRGVESRVEALGVNDLTPGELIVRARWSGINYKDSLAVTGKARILTGSPRIAGIELVGEVLEGDAPGIGPGSTVLVHGFQTGIEYDGGFSEIVRVPAAHAMLLPVGLSAHEIAILGVPAFTCALALERFERMGVSPESGLVAISGSTGAVGIMAIGILKRAGYRVAALTRNLGNSQALRALGADEVIEASFDDARRPVEEPRFAAAIDNVGGSTLSWMLRSLQNDGVLASVGNAADNAFSGNVLPFILRNVTMLGIQANAPRDVRKRLWARLASDWKPDFSVLRAHVREVSLDGLLEHCERQVQGGTSGRTLLALA
jgi:putative YhdH/YhfP family quinone oxidoreductase